jgi:uncharacterized membrane protein YhaH (DUF805 family)
MTEEDAYNIALQEMQNQQVSQGIWAKAMAFSEGDEKRAKANYLRFRAEQLLKAERGYATASFGIGIASILFSPYGRIPRWIFAILLAGCTFIFILGGVIIDAQSSGYYRSSQAETMAIVLCLPFFALSAWILLCAHFKRARDAGANPSMVLVYIIPMFGWLFLVYYLFAPSESSKPPEPSKNE